MQLLSNRWSVSFGQMTLNGIPKADKVDAAMALSASMFKIPSSPDGEVKIAAPCGLWDPAAPVVPLHFLDEDGSTWVATGTRALANTPNPSLVEARFRERAKVEFGDNWHLTKKKKLRWLQKVTRADVAMQTPFRLSEAGALFVNLESGALIAVGHAGALVAADLVGRCSEWTSAHFAQPDKTLPPALLAYLRLQEGDVLPWPTGTATLMRKRGDSRDGCSVKMLSWAPGSEDGEDLVHQGWMPTKIQLMWGDGRVGTLDCTGRLSSVAWGGRLNVADPTEAVEFRLGRLRDMQQQVETRLASLSSAGTPLLTV